MTRLLVSMEWTFIAACEYTPKIHTVPGAEQDGDVDVYMKEES